MRFAALMLAMFAPLPALALSCIAPSVERSYHEVNDAKEEYVVVHGRLTLDTRKLPSDGSLQSNPPKMTKVPATLNGLSLNKSGFQVPFDQDIMLEVACFGPWCGSMANGADVLAFVRRDEGRYALGVNPCGGHVFTPAKPAQLKQVRQCFVGGPCKAE
ncbi:hypothetical protein FIU94_03850 [Sulfitobacter sp. THAF37]|uniref:hypothetical protein n=1 Tax=Sulfitobacter sp. THAF37 TaxID=2587855 RepID=UPI001268FB29|nr:hypothetical protein [Sulfitobacter sp. THAF37]QFT57948.1 hypothetical protein FIU94_03850 [Sulfitobacter sp. THAF37]